MGETHVATTNEAADQLLWKLLGHTYLTSQTRLRGLLGT